MLEKIHTRADLCGLSRNELSDLAQEMRQVIIETVARNGGHLASNLGAVELTLALHRAFELPQDKLVLSLIHIYLALMGLAVRLAGAVVEILAWGAPQKMLARFADVVSLLLAAVAAGAVLAIILVGGALTLFGGG